MAETSAPGESLDKNASAPTGEPKQALSGGGSNVQAGSAQGGSRSGSETPAIPQGGFDPDVTGSAEPSAAGEARAFASPDGEETAATRASDSVNNTGEPDQMAKRTDIERVPGDDVDAATG
ncbi:MAG TPA: hypothetical protein VEA15_07300 [Caulobacteraceae bacterium]|nr:hypothetical protein [Caulobacteraceae bacterium]